MRAMLQEEYQRETRLHLVVATTYSMRVYVCVFFTTSGHKVSAVLIFIFTLLTHDIKMVRQNSEQ